MEPKNLISNGRDLASVRRVYGEPYEKNGVTVIPAATVTGIGGSGDSNEDRSTDSNRDRAFGLTARPSGAWIVEEGRVTWKPAVDVNRIVFGGQIIALAAIIVTGRILKPHPKSRHSGFELVHGVIKLGSALVRRSQAARRPK